MEISHGADDTPLTHNEILKAKPQEKDITLLDGDGLFLLFKTSGKKLWRFRYQRPASSSRINLTPGSYPALTLAAARQMREPSRRLIGFRNGVFDTATGTFSPHRREHWLRTVNSVDYNCTASG